MLTKTELKKFEKMLMEERDRLMGSVRSIEEASRTEGGRDSGGDLTSYAESGTDSFELETSLNIASGESQRLMDIADALMRVQKGTYGICEGSGKPIPKKRLEAFPAARYCVEYQEELEREQQHNRQY